MTIHDLDPVAGKHTVDRYLYDLDKRLGGLTPFWCGTATPIWGSTTATSTIFSPVMVWEHGQSGFPTKAARHIGMRKRPGRSSDYGWRRSEGLMIAPSLGVAIMRMYECGEDRTANRVQ
jgi:hypothetical protein